jgi:hypothetical protein
MDKNGHPHTHNNIHNQELETGTQKYQKNTHITNTHNNNGNGINGHNFGNNNMVTYNEN